MEIEMKFAWIPPGTFLMGGGYFDEDKPIHRVTLSKGFYMAIVPVTQAQWQAVMGYNPSSSYRGDNLPVQMVSWHDCQEFCATLHKLTGKPIRLPTDAEWEYACRAGTTTDYYSGNYGGALQGVGWFSQNCDGALKPVGQLAANAWGLFDMHGNVWEWCEDGRRKYTNENITDLQDQLLQWIACCVGVRAGPPTLRVPPPVEELRGLLPATRSTGSVFASAWIDANNIPKSDVTW
jgi:formylglycine-generating enzyme required for sulfatase activity